VIERQKTGKKPSTTNRFDGFLYLLKKGALPHEIAVLRIPYESTELEYAF
jgi:hypothetical protein